MALDAQTSVVLAGRGQASALAVLVHRVHDPVDTGIVSDTRMLGIHADDLEILVGGILVNPVRVQHTQIGCVATGAFLGNRTNVTSKLELVDTLVFGLTMDNTLLVDALAATSAHGDTEDGVTLLGLVAELVGLVRTSRTSNLADLLVLTVFPRSTRRKGAWY